MKWHNCETITHMCQPNHIPVLNAQYLIGWHRYHNIDVTAKTSKQATQRTSLECSLVLSSTCKRDIYYGGSCSVGNSGIYYSIICNRYLLSHRSRARDSVRSGPRATPLLFSNQTASFLGLFFLRKEKFTRSCAHPMLVTRSCSRNKSHQLGFLGDFRSCSLPQVVRDNTLKTCHPMSLYRSSNAKITSDVLKVSLNNSFKDCWHLCIKIKMY
jgi:hypothetical protein